MRSIVNDPLAKNVGRASSLRATTNAHGYGGNSGDNGHGQAPGGYGGNGGWNNPPPGQRDVQRETGGEWNMASNRGGAHGNQQTNTVMVNSGIVNDGSFASGGAAVDGGEFEKGKVASICRPGGVSMTPAKGEIDEFMGMMDGMDADVVCEATLDLLTSERKEQRAKTWGLIGALKEDGKCDAFLTECKDELYMRFQNEEQIRVKLVAKKVLAKFGPATNGGGKGGKERSVSLEDAVAAVERTASSEVADLLDFGGGNGNSNDSQVTGFTQGSEESYVRVDTPPNSKPNAPPPPPPGGGDMFGGLMVKNADTKAATSTTPPPPAAPAHVLPTNVPAPTPPQTTVDMFGGMSITKSASSEGPLQPPQPTATTAAAGGASSFGFLSGSASPGTAPPAVEGDTPAAAVDPFSDAGLNEVEDRRKPVMPDVIEPQKSHDDNTNNDGKNTFDPLLGTSSSGSEGGGGGGGQVRGGRGATARVKRWPYTA